MISRKTLVIFAAASILVTVLIIIRISSQTRGTVGATDERVVTVSVAPVRFGEIRNDINVTGTVEGINEAEVISETSGKVVAIVAEVDTYLPANGKIALVESDLQKIALDQARAQTAAAVANNDKAELDLKRVMSLYSQNAVSESQKENAELAAKAALAQLRGAQAAEKLAQKHFDDTALRTPIAGRLAQKFITPGKMVSPGMHIATVVDDNRLKMEVGISEQYVASVKREDEVEISSDAVPGAKYIGSVKSIALKADPLTRTFLVEIDFSNDARRSMKSGMFARAAISASRGERSLVVPSSSLMETGDAGTRVFVVHNYRAVMRDVTVGTRGDSLVTITSGLAAGDTVVTFGQQIVRDGGRITYKVSD